MNTSTEEQKRRAEHVHALKAALDFGYSIMDGRQEVEHFDTYDEALAYVSRTDNDYTELNIADTEAVLQWHEIYD